MTTRYQFLNFTVDREKVKATIQKLKTRLFYYFVLLYEYCSCTL